MTGQPWPTATPRSTFSSRWCATVLGAALLLLGVGCGEQRVAEAPATQVVDITMREMSFTPDSFEFTVGDVVTFRFHNEGAEAHEAVIGSAEFQQKMEAMMAAGGGTGAPTTTTTSTTTTPAGGPGRSLRLRHPGMGLPNVVDVPAGGTGEITYSLGRAGVLLIQCHYAGHLEAGMTATITVRPRV